MTTSGIPLKRKFHIMSYLEREGRKFIFSQIPVTFFTFYVKSHINKYWYDWHILVGEEKL